jgi:Ku protein
MTIVAAEPCGVAVATREGVGVPQAVWTGQLSFGLVNIPVRLYNATSPKSVRFHHYDARTGRRIRYRRVAAGPPLESDLPPPSFAEEPERFRDEPRPSPEERAADAESPGAHDEDAPARGPAAPSQSPQAERPEGTPALGRPAGREDDHEVPWGEVVKGFEIEPGRVVTVTPEELGAVAPERSRILEVEGFVALSEIDPVYFEKSYYLVPERGAAAERPYRLLYRAMQAAGEVAVGRFVLRTKEHLAAVRPGDEVLILETLFFADEIRDPRELWFPTAEEPPERELKMAQHFVESLAGGWDPARHRDTYRERLLELLRSKAGEARTVAEEEKEETVSPAVDLLEALKASVEAAKAARASRRETG